MKFQHFLITAFLLSINIPGRYADDCPVKSPCFCLGEITGENLEFVVECQNYGLFDFPEFKKNSTRIIDRVSFSKNYIRGIPERAFGTTRPRVIDLSNNAISYIHEDAFAGVEDHVIELRLASNALFTWPQDGISKLSSLERIDVTYNQGVGRFDERSFIGLGNLREIIIGDCKRQLYIDDNAFQPLTKLSKLSIKSCSIESIPLAIVQISSLKQLDLTSNFIRQIPDGTFHGLRNLKTLRLGLNLLENEDSILPDSFVGLENLEELYMENCGMSKLTSRSLHHLKSLKKLVLSFNHIEFANESPFRRLDSIEEIVLDDNPTNFTKHLFEGVEDTLKVVSIRTQNLKTLPKESLRVLTTLDTVIASDNDIEYIDKNFTNGITAWRYELKQNSIHDIHPNAFDGKRHPVQLFLGQNNIESLNFSANTHTFSVIEVRNNPIKCDCDTYKLAKIPSLLVMGSCEFPIKNQSIGGADFDAAMFFECAMDTHNTEGDVENAPGLDVDNMARTRQNIKTNKNSKVVSYSTNENVPCRARITQMDSLVGTICVGYALLAKLSSSVL